MSNSTQKLKTSVLNLTSDIKKQIPYIKSKFSDKIILKYKKMNYLIYGNDISKNDFKFKELTFRNNLIGYVPVSDKKKIGFIFQ